MDSKKDKLKIGSRVEILKLPYLVLATLILSTIGITYLYYQSARSKDSIRFNNEVNRVQTALETKIGLYTGLLRSGRGYIESRKDLTREGFANFVKSLELEKNYVGVQGIGYSVIISPEEREALTARMKAEGYPNFKIFPADERDFYQAIIYLEPDDRQNRAAIGYDMSTEETRRAAIERARDTGEAAATGKVVLIQEIESQKQLGFLIYLPVYKDGIIPETVTGKRENIQGYVYSPFRAGNFLNEIQQVTNTEGIGVTIYDGANNPENIMARTTSQNNGFFAPQIGENFSAQNEINFAGRNWIIAYNSLPSFADQSSVNWTPLIFLSGIAFSFLLFGMTYWESSARAKLQTVAAELFESEKQKRRLLVKEQDARKVAEKANQAKDEFISVVSHELRTPLNAIAGWTRILKTEDLPEIKKKLALEKIEKNLRQQTNLVDDLLGYSQMVSEETDFNKKEIIFSELFEDVYKKVKPQAQAKGIKLHRDNNLNGSKVIGDEEKLKTVINNLLSNAIKFTPEGGTIEAKLDKKGDEVQLVVKDDGIGISSKFMPHVFERFQQADSSITRRYGGLGLSLAISKHIVTLHNGTIEAHSEGLGKGAVFVVRFPYQKNNH